LARQQKKSAPGVTYCERRLGKAAQSGAGRKRASRRGFVRWRDERLKRFTECVQAFSPALCSPNSDEYAGHDCESGANGHYFNFQGRHGLILSCLELCSRENNLCLNFSAFVPQLAQLQSTTTL